MNNLRKFSGLMALAVLGAFLVGCGDDETKADPKLVESMNSQRAAQQPGTNQAQQPPTGR